MLKLPKLNSKSWYTMHIYTRYYFNVRKEPLTFIVTTFLSISFAFVVQFSFCAYFDHRPLVRFLLAAVHLSVHRPPVGAPISSHSNVPAGRNNNTPRGKTTIKNKYFYDSNILLALADRKKNRRRAETKQINYKKKYLI